MKMHDKIKPALIAAALMVALPAAAQGFRDVDDDGGTRYDYARVVKVDAIVQLTDGRWGAFEVKLGPGLVDAGAESLLKFRKRVDTARSGEPSVLAVVVGTGLGYVRPDGVAVIPVGALAP